MESQPNVPLVPQQIPRAASPKVSLYTAACIILAVGALLCTGKGWMTFLVGPVAIASLILTIVFTQLYRSKEQSGTLHPWAWPVLLGYQIIFFLACFSVPFLGDTRDTSAFTFIAIPDSQTSSLDELSSVVAFIAFIVSFLLGLAVIFFVIKRYGSSPPVAVSPTSPLPPSVSANTVPQQPVQPPVLAPVSPAPGEGTTTSGVPAASPNQPDLPKTE